MQKNSKLRMRSRYWLLSIKTPVLGIDRGRVSFCSRFNFLKKTKNVLGSKNNDFYFLCF